MKRGLIVFLTILLVAGLFVFVCACEDSPVGKVEITTSKSGSVDVVVYQDVDSSKEKASLTPTVATAEKSITDDGNGLFFVNLNKVGDGSVDLSADKAKEGDEVTLTCSPSEGWALESVFVGDNDRLTEPFRFTMPGRNVNVNVVFRDLRHRVNCADYIVWDGKDNVIVEGETYVFTVDYSENNRYYDDEDVICEKSDGSGRVPVIRYNGQNKYTFVAPNSDCYLSLTTHPWRSLTSVAVFTSDGYERTFLTEQCSIEVYRGDFSYEMGTKVKDVSTFRVKLNFDRFPYRVTDLYSMTSSHYFSFTADATDPGTFTFSLDHEHQGGIPDDVELGVRIEEDTTMHAVNIQKEGWGAVSSGRKYAKEGDTVIIEARPREGYVLASLSFTTDGENYTKIAEKDGKYSFVMPTSDVTVLARFLTEDKKHDFYINSDSSQIKRVGIYGKEGEYYVGSEEYEGETVYFHVDAEDCFIMPEDVNGIITIDSLGNGDFSFVMPDTDVTIVVKTRQAFEWSIRSFKSKFGDFLKTWTITGSISGEHKDEATFKVAKGESLEISFTAKDEERLFRLSIESGGEDRIVYIADSYLGYITSYSTWIDEVLANSYNVEIIVTVKA